jgi:pectin methylesterase-like acyl-CoA thioesterase
MGGASAGAGGSAGSAGAAGSGGSGSSADCNSVTGQTVITVGPSGANFQTVQAALNSLSKTNTTPTQIRIAPGTYKEKLTVQIPNITLCGQAGKASTTILTYSDNANTSNGNGGTLGTTGSASTNITSNNVSAENLTFANSTVLGGSQAVAVLVSGDQVQFRNSRFISFQDTLYVRKAKQYFRDCYIEGTVDFIFGDATAVFQGCTVHNVSGGTAATAPNTDQAVAYGLVFLGGELTAASSISAGSIALGRNWGAYGAAAYIQTKLGAHIKPAGWVPMGTNTLDTARFSEYKTTGAGATASAISARASQSKQLSEQEAANYTLTKIFGAWVPSFSK